MKSRLFKRIIAMGLMVMVIFGDATPVIADSVSVETETVSGGDAIVTEAEPVDATETETEVLK